MKLKVQFGLIAAVAMTTFSSLTWAAPQGFEVRCQNQRGEFILKSSSVYQFNETNGDAINITNEGTDYMGCSIKSSKDQGMLKDLFFQCSNQLNGNDIPMASGYIDFSNPDRPILRARIERRMFGMDKPFPKDKFVCAVDVTPRDI